MKKEGKSRILVVDDEPSVLTTYKMILEQKGYEVRSTTSAREARSALMQQDFDLLLCDLSLEEKHTGFELIDYARRLRPQVRCLLVTGYSTDEIAAKAAENKVMVLFKPIDIEEFLATIAAQLRFEHEQQTKPNIHKRALA